MNFLQPQNPIFIVGCPRSGTTVLTVQLGRHPDIVTTPETSFFELITHFWPIVLRKQPVSNKNVDKIFKIPRFRKLNLNLNEVKQLLDNTDRSHRSFFCVLMECFRNQSGKSFWCEKTPRHLYHVKKILEFFPNAKIIHIVRDGRDVANSLRKVYWRESNLLTQAHEWVLNAKIGLALNKRLPKERFLTIFYEDLLTTPEDVLSVTCKFIGVKYYPFLFSNDKKDNFGDTCVTNWTGNEKDISWLRKTKEKPDVKRIAAWKTECTQDEIVRLNYIMGVWLKHWKYEQTEVQLEKRERFFFQLQSNNTRFLRYLLDFLTRYAPRFRTKKYLKYL